MIALSHTLISLFGALALFLNPPGGADESLTPGQALQQLQIGHARYLCGKADRPHADAGRRGETSRGQSPFAVVLSCADSRVPAEIVFDQGIGDLFVVRVAGNVVDDVTAGSIEYAIEHLHTPLIVVVGHRRCGAVLAAAGRDELHGNIGALVKHVKPAVEQALKEQPGVTSDALLAAAINNNVWNSIEDLLTSPVIAPAVKSSKLQIVGGVYDIETGSINWLGQHPRQAGLLDRPAKVAGESAERAAPERSETKASDPGRAPSPHGPAGEKNEAPPPRPQPQPVKPKPAGHP